MSTGSDKSARDLLTATFQTYRKMGLLETIRRGLQVFNINYQGYYYDANCRYKRLKRAYSFEADPYATIRVSPAEIEYWPSGRWDKWEHMGDVRGGAWDRPGRRFEDSILYESLESHFVDGVPWENVEKVERAIAAIESGEPAWNNSLTVDEVFERCEHLDALYERIRTDGFKSQSELQGKPNRRIVRNGSFDRSQTDVVVHIDRNGEFRFCDGRHRFAIAKILDLDSIPVRVVVRHERWQRIREQVGRGKPLSDIDGLTAEMLSHPDLKDLNIRRYY